MSIEPPAANGTTILMGPDGQDAGASGVNGPTICPAAPLATRGAARPPSRTARRVGMMPFRDIFLTPADCRASASASPPSCPSASPEHAQSPPRRVRHDHIVDVAALGGDEG